VYLAGPIALELGERVLEERRLPGRQGRRALVYLVLERARPVPHGELADAVWGEAVPPAWETALSAVVSKLRALAGHLGLPGRDTITGVSGCYHLRLPPGAWVDVEAAVGSLDEAEGALRKGLLAPAWVSASIAATVAGRPLLPGLDGDWIERRREALRGVRVRALDCLADVAIANGEPALAAQFAEEAVSLEPFREGAWRRLIRAHQGAGDRVAAVRAYERCRRLLADELGVAPSPETEVLHRALREGH
jgi:DNA-binding SARP family transcriptional activator